MPPKRDTPERHTWIHRQKKTHVGLYDGEKNPNFGKKHSEETRRKISEAVKKNRKPNSKETSELLSKIRREQWANDPDRKHAAAERARNRVRTDDERARLSEIKILALNDIWYGGVKYNDPQPNKYCLRWNADLRSRIRECWGHKSVLSGATKADNKNRALCCHHVYYQKKACCEWDEDTTGYYCMIDGERYNIRGDPNKFVTLTTAENTMVNFDKMKWIKIFEDIIEAHDGVCYVPKSLSSPEPISHYATPHKQMDSKSKAQTGSTFPPVGISCEG